MDALRRAIITSHLRLSVARTDKEMLAGVAETLALSIILNWAITRHHLPPLLQMVIDQQMEAATAALKALQGE